MRLKLKLLFVPRFWRESWNFQAEKMAKEWMLDHNHNLKWNFITWKGWTSCKKWQTCKFYWKSFDPTWKLCWIQFQFRRMSFLRQFKLCTLFISRSSFSLSWTSTLYLIQLNEQPKKRQISFSHGYTVNKLQWMYQIEIAPKSYERKSFTWIMKNWMVSDVLDEAIRDKFLPSTKSNYLIDAMQEECSLWFMNKYHKTCFQLLWRDIW